MASASVAVEGGEDVTRTFLSFLNSFSSDDGNADAGGEGAENPSGYRDYVEQLEIMYERSGTTIYVNFQHLMEFDGVLAHLARLAKHGGLQRFPAADQVQKMNDRMLALFAIALAVHVGDRRERRDFPVIVHSLGLSRRDRVELVEHRARYVRSNLR